MLSMLQLQQGSQTAVARQPMRQVDCRNAWILTPVTLEAPPCSLVEKSLTCLHRKQASFSQAKAKMADDNCVVRGFMGREDVFINGWIFCIHGLEHCHRCTVDHRLSNSIQIEDELTEAETEAITDYGIMGLEDRPAISVAGKWKVLPNGTTACLEHSKVGCIACFNFKQQVVANAANSQK